MGEVWLAEDPVRGRIAVKQIRPDLCRQDLIDRFRAEFATLTRLRHPCLVEAWDYLVDPETGRHAYTMEYVEGNDFTAATGGLPPDRIAVLAEQVCDVLDYVHTHDLVHGDIKPGNLIVRGDAVKLMDFGLADRPGPHGLRGSLEYLAPEIIQGQPHDRRADLYALGAVLYEALTRHPPFQGGSRFALLRAHLRSRPDFPARVRDQIPEPLRRIVLRLLCKDPSARFFTAAEVAESLRSLHSVPGRRYLSPAALTGSALAGRSRALDTIDLAIREAASGAGPALIAVSGPVGSGKAALLRDLRARLAARKIPAAPAVCARTAAPLAPVRDWMAWLASHPTPEWALLHRGLAAIEKGAPEAARLALDAVIAASRVTPLVLILQDASWADAATHEFVTSVCLLRHARVIVVAGLTPGEGSVRWDATVRVDLAPFTVSEISEVACAMAGAVRIDPSLASSLAAVSGGIPGAARACLRTLAAEGALYVESGMLGSTVPASTARGLERILEFLDTDARMTAEALAILGHPRPVADIGRIAGLAVDRAAAALYDLERRAIAARNDGTWRLTAPAAAATILAGIPPDSARAMNRAAAALALQENRSLDAARHLFASGGGAEAIACALESTGRDASVAGVLDRILLDPAASPAQRRAATQRLAECSASLGQYAKAALLWKSLTADAAPTERPSVLLSTASALSEADPDACLDLLEGVPDGPEASRYRTTALLRLGRFADVARVQSGDPRIQILRSRAFLCLGRFADAAGAASAAEASLRDSDPRTAAEACALSAESALAVHDPVTARGALDLASDFATRAGSARSQIAVLLAQARLQEGREGAATALATWRRAGTLARSLDEPHGIALASAGESRLLLSYDRFDEADAAATAAVEAAERTSDAADLLEALLVAARAATRLGRHQSAESAGTRALETASRSGPGRPAARAFAARAAGRLAAGRFDEARLDDASARAADITVTDPLFTLELAVAAGNDSEALALAPGLNPGDPRDAARLRDLRGRALLLTDEPPAAGAAVEEFYDLLARARALGVPSITRSAHHGLGRALAAIQFERPAREHFRRALDLLRDSLTHVPEADVSGFLSLPENQALRADILALSSANRAR